MIYLEFTSTPVASSPLHFAVELNVNTIHEGAQLFQAFEQGALWAGLTTKLTLTSIGTQKRRGVEYKRWGSL